MAGFFNAVSAVFVLLMLMGVGYAMGRMGWIAASEKKFLSKYILNIAVPCLCITGVLNHISRDMLSEMTVMFIASLSSVAVMLVLSAITARGLRLPSNQKGVFISMCSFANTLFIGLPVTTQLFGETCIPYVMVYYLSSTIMVQLVGTILIERSGSRKQSLGFRQTIRSIFSKPPILGVLTAVLMLMLNWRPPGFIMRFMGYISDSVSPMALIYCGYILYEIGLKNLRFLKGFPVMLLFRLVVTPAICFGLCILLKVETFPRSVLIVESALPVITQVTVMSGAYGADEKYAASGSCLSTLCGFITIPIWMLMLTNA